MKKFLISGSLIIGFALFTFSQRFPENEDEGRNVVIPSTQPSSAALPTPSGKGRYRDGQYIGLVADAYYGNIQVKAIITNGNLSDVQFLQYPSDRHTSVLINTQAMPYLRQEAIAAQSASVDIVSGATDSSQAFRQSLADALTQAK